jgi:hypothetical protein
MKKKKTRMKRGRGIYCVGDAQSIARNLESLIADHEKAIHKVREMSRAGEGWRLAPGLYGSPAGLWPSPSESRARKMHTNGVNSLQAISEASAENPDDAPAYDRAARRIEKATAKIPTLIRMLGEAIQKARPADPVQAGIKQITRSRDFSDIRTKLMGAVAELDALKKSGIESTVKAVADALETVRGLKLETLDDLQEIIDEKNSE